MIYSFNFEFYERQSDEATDKNQPTNSTSMNREFDQPPTVAEVTRAFRTFLAKAGMVE